MRREEIFQNFEKMELVLIVDFHYFNMIFCKEELMLNDRKTAILLNIFWHLLMNKNQAYVKQRDELERIEPQEGDSKQLDQKTVQDDVTLFKNLILDHSRGKTESELKDLGQNTNVPYMKVFTIEQVKMIVEYAYQSYIDKFNLYKYVFENKKKNEEVKLMITISEPARVPPLREALYMGSDQRPVFIEEYETTSKLDEHDNPAAEQSGIENVENKDQDDPEIDQAVQSDTGLRPMNSKVKGVIEQDPDAELIEKKVLEMEKEVNLLIEKNDTLIDEKISTKGKKKK